MPVYDPILSEYHRGIIIGVHKPKYRSFTGEAGETPEIDDCFLRLNVLLFILDTNVLQRLFQFLTVRAVFRRVHNNRAYDYHQGISCKFPILLIRDDKPLSFPLNLPVFKEA